VHQRLTDILQTRPHDNLVVITGWSFVTATRVHNRDEALIILFHVAVGKSKLPQ
jgi:hypothetical protein